MINYRFYKVFRTSLSPDEYSNWRENINKDRLPKVMRAVVEHRNIVFLINSLFHWTSSPQGHDYWFNIYERLLLVEIPLSTEERISEELNE